MVLVNEKGDQGTTNDDENGAKTMDTWCHTRKNDHFSSLHQPASKHYSSGSGAIESSMIERSTRNQVILFRLVWQCWLGLGLGLPATNFSLPLYRFIPRFQLVVSPL